jgi:phosphate transport system substrate-binding protein
MSNRPVASSTLGLVFAIALGASSLSHAQAARDYISIVGSSTVYPFTTVVAEQFGRTTRFKTPKIESTGTGGGVKLFCSGVGVSHPDVVNASRRIKSSELDQCAGNGVEDVIEIKIGYDGLVLANSVEAPVYELTVRDVYLALAKQVPDPDGSGELVANPYTRWSQVDPNLPDTEIEVLGPPPTSGTRDSFLELVMEPGCATMPTMKAIEERDEKEFRRLCHTLREDGAFVEMTENDNLIVQKISENPLALGIFGFSFLDQNSDIVHAALMDGVEPTFDTIADGTYEVARPLFIYVKKAHVGVIPGLEAFLDEYVSDKASGDFGYLTDRGLVPLPEAERTEVRARVENLTPIDLAAL